MRHLWLYLVVVQQPCEKNIFCDVYVCGREGGGGWCVCLQVLVQDNRTHVVNSTIGSIALATPPCSDTVIYFRIIYVNGKKQFHY